MNQQYPQQPPAVPMQVPQQAPARKRRVWPWVVGALAAIVVVATAVNGSGDEPSPKPGATGAPAGNEADAAGPAGPAKPAAPATRSVVYRVSGTGTASSITYTTDGMTTTNQEMNVALPWEKTITLPTGEAVQLVSILAQGDGSGTVDVAILVDGQVIKEAHTEGYGIASANENIGTIQ